ncbi:MAG: hypothetical protein CVU90_03565 [Firmicutes bacterium HGW-Firmicutes-15]|nr:MAG: hypothetical protein CVU90_03565 [Firmicutes bacterium HGW-Firmicutes-15]
MEIQGVDRSYRLLSECNQVLLLAHDENQLFQEICRVVVDIGYRFAWVGFIENDEVQTVIPVAQGGHGEGYLEDLRIELTDPERWRGPTGMAIHSGKPQIVRNIASDPNYTPWRNSANQRAYASSIALPLKIEGGASGALNIYADEIDAFDNCELALLTKLADNLSYGIMSLRARADQKKVREELEESVKNLRNSLDGAVKALSAAGEKRDPYTADHQKRVSEIAQGIATIMGLTQKEIKSIVIAGLLHDIGKMSIPLDILNKPRALTEIEMALVKTHSQNGFEIVQLIPFKEPVAEIVLQHHERIDGSGYPFGLTINDIIPAARILAVADVVEAISSLRPYRQSLGVDKALVEILQNKGILYDEEVVNACLKFFDKK